MALDAEDIRKIVMAHVKAWNSGSPEAVAATYAENAIFVINRGEPMIGRSDIAAMAKGFMSDFPDMVLRCVNTLSADDHAIYIWTFEGHHKETNQHVKFSGWEEWELDKDLKVTSSLG